jgi:V/A-type H+-transporting ATPase subunit C
MKRPSRLDYAYAVGRVRALEKKLVERAVFSEAVEEKDFPGAVKIVFDAGEFPEEMTKIKNSEELDGFLEREEKELLSLVAEIFLEEDILEIFLIEKIPEQALKISERMNYSFIHGYLRHKIDLANLKIFCRLKYLGASREKLEKFILKGGFSDEQMLLQNFEATFGDIGDKIQATPYAQLWNRGIDTLEEKETFIELERGIEDFLMAYLRKAKYIVFGPEPIFAFGLAKKHELSLIRLLGIGKLSHIPPLLLKQRISETYV